MHLYTYQSSRFMFCLRRENYTFGASTALLIFSSTCCRKLSTLSRLSYRFSTYWLETLSFLMGVLASRYRM